MVSNEEDQVVLLHDKEWERQQIKSFTVWINSHLKKVGGNISDINTDLRDGKMLIKLLEVISKDRLSKPERGNLRVHHVNNVNRCLEFIEKKNVKLANIGSEEIVDGNVKMTLGMIWTIILRFAINVDIEGYSAKDGLLLWAKRKTEGYKDVNVTNFTRSFKDGLAFCALIHRHRPDLLDYSSLKKENDVENLNLAFDVAEKYLDIPKMLDVEDTRTLPDEKSIMTYVSCYYHAFSSSQQMESAARRITKVLETNKENQSKIDLYEKLSSDLLKWINQKVPEFQDKGSENPLMEELLSRIKTMDVYKSDEKPPKCDDKAKLESTYNTLRTKLHLLNRPEYIPLEGCSVKDINDKWKEMEKYEKSLLDYLHMKIQQLYYLDHLLKKFRYKCEQQDFWMSGRADILNANIEEMQLLELLTHKRKVAALQNEIGVRNSRIKTITSLHDRLVELKCPIIDEVNERHNGIISSWEDVKSKCKIHLENLKERESTLQKIDDLRLLFAQKAPEVKAFIDDGIEDMNDTYQAQSVNDIVKLSDELGAFSQNLSSSQKALGDLVDIENELVALATNATNPYTSVTVKELQDRWNTLESLVSKRREMLSSEHSQQEKNEALKKSFAAKAEEIETFRNEFLHKIQKTAVGNKETSLEVTISELLQLSKEIEEFYVKAMADVDSLYREMQAAQIFFNPYTTHTSQSISAGYQQLVNTLSASKNEVENQILIRDSGNLTEQQVKDYRAAFDYFDKLKLGSLSLEDFRSFLVSLGHNVSTEDKSGDKEFERILGSVDQEKNGHITFNNFLNFIATENKDNDTAEQLISSFRILSGGADYIMPDVIRREFTPERAEQIIGKMSPSASQEAPQGALDYHTFAATLYGETDL